MNSTIERYLADLCSRLRALPAPRRDEEMAEVRQHLEAAAATFAAAGMDPQEAEAEAVRRFGDARTVRAGLVRAWRRENGAGTDTLAAFAVVLFALVGLNRVAVPVGPGNYPGLYAEAWNVLSWVLAGVLAGWFAPKRAFRAVLWFLLPLALWYYGQYATLRGCMEQFPGGRIAWTFQDCRITPEWHYLKDGSEWHLTALQFRLAPFLGLPLAACTAALTAVWRRPHRRRRATA
jgi:hypothetical protein